MGGRHLLYFSAQAKIQASTCKQDQQTHHLKLKQFIFHSLALSNAVSEVPVAGQFGWISFPKSDCCSKKMFTERGCLLETGQLLARCD